LRKRLHDVASEAVSQLDIAAVQIWGWDGGLSRLTVLTSAGVGLAPGAAFGAGGEGHLRLCFAQSEARLRTACTRVAQALSAMPPPG
jgi:bifunctional pyridoxal-dependent enzyme with beta-cystathionase and maltose regulon repressor activities